VCDSSALNIATSAQIVGHHISVMLHHRFRIPTYKDSERLLGERMLAPPLGSRPLSRWARGPLSVPWGPGAPVALAPASRLPGQGSSGAAMCHLGSNTYLLAQDSSRATTCPEDGLCRLQAIKQISHGDLNIMMSIRACARVSSKALRNKGCSTLS
jgi:hypothetical protein